MGSHVNRSGSTQSHVFIVGGTVWMAEPEDKIIHSRESFLLKFCTLCIQSLTVRLFLMLFLYSFANAASAPKI